MGEKSVSAASDERQARVFTQSILRDLEALEAMMERELFERGVRRIGVEQELFLINGSCRPAPRASRVLASLDDPLFTNELAEFNLEANLEPMSCRGNFLSELEEQLQTVIRRVDEAAESEGAAVLLTGILPTLHAGDLSLANMTPLERYKQLNDSLLRLRGGDFDIQIRGVDHLMTRHDSVMLEAANTSLQLHLQVEPEEFASLYNLAQLVSAPLLAAATNSPLLLGRRLWHETRVALFERTVDSRTGVELDRGQLPRVSFGDDWVNGSVLEIYRDNAARFRALLVREVDEDPVEQVNRGEIPPLAALALHNSTVWRWNRPCYGVTQGRPHLRIENRVLPSGPSVLDEVANAALFYGMMLGLAKDYEDVASRLDFAQAKANFLAAARQGLDAGFTWLDGRYVAARRLLLDELIPRARDGLRSSGVPAGDVRRYLGTLRARVQSGQTGSRWILSSLRAAQPGGSRRTKEGVLAALTSAMLRHQSSGEPVHRWSLSESRDPANGAAAENTVRSIMSTDLFTVRPHDVVDLATSLMGWKHVRHVPVEDDEGQLVGLLSHRALLRLLQQRGGGGKGDAVAVDEIMDRDPVCIDPETPLREAMHLLMEAPFGCLLVTLQGKLVGIATERDFLGAALALTEPRGTLNAEADNLADPGAGAVGEANETGR